MKLVFWNIEWMNDWFVGGNEVAFRAENPRRGITDVAGLCTRVANVIEALAPDALMVGEGPSDRREMELFINKFLSDTTGPKYELFGGLDGGAQKLYILYRKGGAFEDAGLDDTDLARSLGDPWETDVDGDLELEPYEFTRVPLAARLKLAGETLRIVGLHTKSKYVHKGEEQWNDPARRCDFVIAALKNRRRISAESMRTRQYLDELIDADPNALVVVVGDFNDGPGQDFFEKHYLTHNVTDILLGSTFYPQRQFRHAFLHRVPQNELFTATFDDFVDGINNRRTLLDHILVSPALEARVQDSGIAHAEIDAQADPAATKERQKVASDHKPASVTIT